MNTDYLGYPINRVEHDEDKIKVWEIACVAADSDDGTVLITRPYGLALGIIVAVAANAMRQIGNAKPILMKIEQIETTFGEWEKNVKDGKWKDTKEKSDD